jgi:hypothetical protein
VSTQPPGNDSVSVEGNENRVVGAGGHHNILGDVHLHVEHPAHSSGDVTAARREKVLADWARYSRRRMIERWAAAGLDDEMVASLADDPTVGSHPSALPPLREQGMVLLEGVFGSGKSVTGERLHQVALAAAMRDAEAPVPVYLDARTVRGALAEIVVDTSASVGDPEKLGVRLVLDGLDGLDELSLTRASTLLAEARSLPQVLSGSRVVATVRPGLQVGLACILPVQISGHVTRETQDGTPTGFLLHQYSYETQPLTHGGRSTARFTYSASGLPPEEWQVTLQRQAELRRTIESLHPFSAPWAHPRAGTAAFPVPSDTPATNLAYRWLWEDLRTLRLVAGNGPR